MEKVLIVFITLLSLAALGLIIALIFLWWVDRKISKSPRRHGRKHGIKLVKRIKKL
ncbi:MAG: hypothetical protein LBJ63_07665 [Prevotellaceae bacterium]|jgi:hypothetical protein|nr:hypothetical protein [Prevotellaceae bacterium]